MTSTSTWRQQPGDAFHGTRTTGQLLLWPWSSTLASSLATMTSSAAAVPPGRSRRFERSWGRDERWTYRPAHCRIAARTPSEGRPEDRIEGSKKCPAHEPEGHDHPKKIFKTAGIVSDARQQLGGRASYIGPGQPQNPAHTGLPENTDQIRGCGLITRRSQVQILPPPPKKVQVRAGAQAPALLLPRIVSHRILTNPVISHRCDADMRGSMRELCPGVWELRVSLGYDPETGKRH